MRERFTRRRWPVALLIAAAFLGVVGWIAWLAYDPGWGYDVRGVDVSRHQGAIDWSALADDNTTFAFIKATEGGDWVDPLFERNWREADQAGVIRGAYHFYTLCRTGADQAQNFIETVPVESGMLPPAIDLEFGGNCSARPSVEDFREDLDVFVGMVTLHYGTRPIVYTNPRFYEKYLDDEPPDVIWWLQAPVVQPWGEPEWTFWQYFPAAKDGVSGRVDRNAFRGNRAELSTLLLGPPQRSAAN